jgi:hypothetical protein
MSSGRRRGHYDMTTETLRASTIIAAPAEAVFAVLADPVTHPAIDGTGWVSKALDTAPLTESGQMFRMAMYHANHPNGSYEMTNRVALFDPPRAISWEPGQDIARDGKPQFGGWTWRYDLVTTEPSRTEVTLTYDWTAVSPFLREHITFPPFPVDHLTDSLHHLAELVQQAVANSISARDHRAHWEARSAGTFSMSSRAPEREESQ